MSETNDLQAVIYEESSAHKMDFPLDFVNHMHIQRLAMLVICPQANIIRRIWILIYAFIISPRLQHKSLEYPSNPRALQR